MQSKTFLIEFVQPLREAYHKHLFIRPKRLLSILTNSPEPPWTVLSEERTISAVIGIVNNLQ